MNALLKKRCAQPVGFLLFRALRSTVIIAAIALVVAALRLGRLVWLEIKSVAEQNWPLLLIIFFGVLIWDWWFLRASRPRSDGERENEQRQE